MAVQVSFQTAHEQPGVVFMQIESKEDQVADPRVARICVILNASPGMYSAPFPDACGQLDIHPQMKGLPHVADCVIDNSEHSLSVSAHTILVLVETSYAH